MAKVTSEDLKTLAMSWCRFYKRLDLVCSEDPQRSADCLATDSSIQCRVMIEIETKISIADLKNDLSKTSGSGSVIHNKHERLAWALKKDVEYQITPGMWSDKDPVHGVEKGDKDHSCLPSQFYFMIPESIKDKALAVVQDLFPHCGLMVGRVCRSGHFHTRYVEVIKRAPVLHKRLISKGIKNQMSARITSELCGLRLDNMRSKWSNEKEEVSDGIEECPSGPDSLESGEA
jgi:hypothetical protein